MCTCLLINPVLTPSLFACQIRISTGLATPDTLEAGAIECERKFHEWLTGFTKAEIQKLSCFLRNICESMWREHMRVELLLISSTQQRYSHQLVKFTWCTIIHQQSRQKRPLRNPWSWTLRLAMYSSHRINCYRYYVWPTGLGRWRDRFLLNPFSKIYKGKHATSAHVWWMNPHLQHTTAQL